MKNFLIILFTMFASIVSFSQVGIGTQTPQANLHVNGKAQITNSLNVGGNANTAGNPGINGQLLASQGDNQPPKWIFPSEQNIPKLVSVAVKPGTESVGTNAYLTIKFIVDSNTVMDNEYISYSNGIFTIKKAGYYQITGNVKVIPPSSTPRDGTAAVNILKGATRILRATSANPTNSSDPRYLDIFCIHQFSVNETFLMEAVYSRAFSAGDANISVTFLSVN